MQGDGTDKSEIDEELIEDLDVGDDAENVVGGMIIKKPGGFGVHEDPCMGGEFA